VYREGLLTAVAEEISKYKLDLVGMQEIKWDRGATDPAGECTCFCGKENGNQEYGNQELGTGFSNIRESYQQLRG
jgi:hypothetical protein